MNTKELGCTARDSITGFKGVITGKCYYLTGCEQLLLMPTVDDKNSSPEGRWFDAPRVEIGEEAIFRLRPPAKEVKPEEVKPGADEPAPIK